MLKRALSVLLVLLMVFALCSVAVADEAKKNEKEETVYWIDLDTGYYIISHDGQPHLKEVDHVQYGPDHVTYYGWGLYGGLIMGNTQQERGNDNKGTDAQPSSQGEEEKDKQATIPPNGISFTWFDLETGARYCISENRWHYWYEHLMVFDHIERDDHNPYIVTFYGYHLHDCPWIAIDVEVDNGPEEKGTGGKDTDNMQPAQGEDKKDKLSVPSTVCFYTWWDLDTGGRYTVKGIGYPYYPEYWQHAPHEHLTTFHHFTGSENPYHVIFYGYGLHDCPWIAKDVKIDNGPAEW